MLGSTVRPLVDHLHPDALLMAPRRLLERGWNACHSGAALACGHGARRATLAQHGEHANEKADADRARRPRLTIHAARQRALTHTHLLSRSCSPTFAVGAGAATAATCSDGAESQFSRRHGVTPSVPLPQEDEAVSPDTGRMYHSGNGAAMPSTGQRGRGGVGGRNAMGVVATALDVARAKNQAQEQNSRLGSSR